jgi:hypothetical protein
MAKLSTTIRASLEDRDRREFLEYVHACGVGQSIEEVRQWWCHFCNAALDWLINKERPVDLYFLKLHQSPYRQDWKDIVSRSVPHKGNHPHILRDHTEFLKRATQLDLAAMRGRACLRNVEVEHLPLWWSMLSKAEKYRLRKLGPHRYAKAFLDSVLRRLAATTRIYAEYARQVGSPCPADVQSRDGSGFRLRETSRLLVRHWRRPARDRFPGALLDALEKPAPEPWRVRSEDGDMCGLSDLQQAFQELRDAWGVVPESRNGKA